MKIFIIGGAGYIGSHVVIECLEKGYEVVVYDNLSSGCEENIFKQTAFIRGDILDYEALKTSMASGIDAIIHLAAFKAAGESMLKPEKYSVNNISGTLNVLNAASATGVKNVIFSSSAAVYGDPQYLPINEEHPTDPRNYYGYTKLSIEGFLHWYEKLKGIRFAALRYFNAAGYDPAGRIVGLEKNPANLLPVIMEVACGKREKLQIFGDDYDTPDGTGVRDYVHVTDLAKAHIQALEYIVKTDSSLIVNLGSENGISVNEMVSAVRMVSQKPIVTEIVGRREGDPASLFATSRKAKSLLQWNPMNSDIMTLVRTTWNVYKSRFSL